jgi:nucleotide-binding universal stress UspA family protein
MLAIKTILHPTDFSKYSNYAFHVACSLARDYGARLLVVHTYSPPALMSFDGMEADWGAPDWQRAMLDHKLRQVAFPGGDVKVEHRLVEGFAAEGILDAAKEAKADLIVMGTHGRTGFNRLLMGSVAEEVLRKATCPVLTIKAPSAADAVKGAEEAAESCAVASAVAAP